MSIKKIEQGHLVPFYLVHIIEKKSVYMELEQINIHKKNTILRMYILYPIEHQGNFVQLEILVSF